MKYFLFILLSLFIAQPISVQASINSNKQSIVEKRSPKKAKRLKRIAKFLDGIPSKTKGILALVSGVLAVFSVFFSIAMSFALSVPGVIIGIVLATLFGTAAMILGITAIKEDDGGKVFGLIGVIIGGIGLLMLIGLTIGSLFFS